MRKRSPRRVIVQAQGEMVTLQQPLT